MDELVGKLTVIFHLVNDWLHYAEAKNAILLAFAGAGITANVTLLAATQNLLGSLKTGLIVSTILLCICALICALSFIPKIDLDKILWARTKPVRKLASPASNDNLYYFGHLRKYKARELLDSVNNFYFEQKIQSPYSKECVDLAEQVTVNSEITFFKFQLFTRAVYCLIASIIVIPLIVLVGSVV